jgi:hypothetical protein
MIIVALPRHPFFLLAALGAPLKGVLKGILAAKILLGLDQ